MKINQTRQPKVFDFSRSKWLRDFLYVEGQRLGEDLFSRWGSSANNHARLELKTSQDSFGAGDFLFFDFEVVNTNSPHLQSQVAAAVLQARENNLKPILLEFPEIWSQYHEWPPMLMNEYRQQLKTLTQMHDLVLKNGHEYYDFDETIFSLRFFELMFPVLNQSLQSKEQFENIIRGFCKEVPRSNWFSRDQWKYFCIFLKLSLKVDERFQSLADLETLFMEFYFYESWQNTVPSRANKLQEDSKVILNPSLKILNLKFDSPEYGLKNGMWRAHLNLKDEVHFYNLSPVCALIIDALQSEIQFNYQELSALVEDYYRKAKLKSHSLEEIEFCHEFEKLLRQDLVFLKDPAQ